MTKILFVCLGNICRSPMAEFVMREKVRRDGLSGRIEVASAGTSDEELGNPVHPGTRSRLRQMGVPMTARTARPMDRSDYAEYDLLIGMEASNVRSMRRICGGDPEGKIHRLLDFSDRPRDIADPWYTGNFDLTYDDVDEGCDALLEHLKERLPR